ncbi:MAG: radical SAM/SPASM domain-containing protein [Comamonadaceae bacterium]|nr:MAG: radical SAM/SPASM domain-containing protein [Comamonadaceae bacterium]
MDPVDRITPVRIRLEASSACQLRCPSCPTTTGDAAATVGKGWLKFAQFRQLLDANPQLREIELSNYGEIFLNPELADILAYAQARGIALFCDNGANLNDAPEAVLEALVRHGLRSMLCSIDGATQEVYATYRVRGTLAAVLANIRRINAFKQQYASPWPELTWQFVAFGHNQHEIPAARALAAELGMKFFVKLSWDADFSPVRDAAALRRDTGMPAASRDEFRTLHGMEYMHGICTQLWLEPQVNWDGKVLGCCRNFWGEFGGNAFSDGLEAAVNTEAIRYARRMLLGLEPARDGIPCTTCDLYRHRERRGDWIRITAAAPATAPGTP